MSIKNFPYVLRPLNGGNAVINIIPDESFHFRFDIVDKKGRIESFSWKPTREEVAQNRVIRRYKYSNFAYTVLVGFWYAYND